MGLHFTIHTAGLDALKSEITSRCTKAEHILATQIAKDTEPYVPMRTGSLRQRTRVKGNQIIYPGPYARYLYYGKLYVDPVTGSPFVKKGVTKVPAVPERELKFYHPGTRSHWFEYSKSQNMKKWENVVAEELERGN